MQVSAIGVLVLRKVARRASGENHKLEMGGVNGGGASYLKPGQDTLARLDHHHHHTLSPGRFTNCSRRSSSEGSVAKSGEMQKHRKCSQGVSRRERRGL